MRNARHLYALVFLCLLALPPGASAYNNPSLKWQTIKTEHFEIHFHEGAGWTARQVAVVAEQVHGPITELYGYTPPTPVHFVIRDTDDYANGAAYFYDNKVEIWATNLEFGLRGTTNWIRNVVTHEYTHIVSIQSSVRLPQRVPALFLQLIGFEEEKRSDVLNGYPNVIASYPISGVLVPPWFAEGVAQYQTPGVQYDCWDAHRDMILRCAVLEDEMLTYDEMGFFGKSSLKSEEVYDHGYGLVSYIASTYGPDALKEISRALRSIKRLKMDGALKKVTGKTGGELYADWKQDLKERYERQIATVEPARTGKALAQDGFMTIAPCFSHDGKRLVYLSNKGSEFSETTLFVMDRNGKNAKPLKGGVSARPRFSPDDSKILYSRKHKVNLYGSTVNDLFVYDLARKKETQLTGAARASDADFSPDGSRIVCVLNGDGTHRIVVMDANGGNERELYAGGKGVQIYNPQYSPDGTRILFGVFEGRTRDIASIRSDGTGFRYEIQSESDERDARWTRAGRGIVFSSDRSGIFNVYELDLDSGWITQHTRVVGGAFMPDISPQHDALAYAGYQARGYSVYAMEFIDITEPVATLDRAAYNQRTAGPFDACAGLRAAARPLAPTSMLALGGRGVSAGTTAADAAHPGPGEPDPRAQLTARKYKSAYTPFQFYPRVILYDGTARFGIFMSSAEVLDKQTFTLGGSYGTNNEYDAFINYEIRNLFPTIFADFFVVRERAKDHVLDGDRTSATFQHSFDFDLRYDLWQADIGLKFEFGPSLSLTRQNDLSLYWTHGEYRVNIEGRQFPPNGFPQSFDGGWKYYIGNQAHLQYAYRAIAPAVDADIHPRGGRSVSFHYLRSFDELFTNGQFAYGFRPIFTDNPYSQYTIDWREFIGLPMHHSLRLRLLASVIDQDVDDFFWFYLGGLDGIRGYTYYSIGGRKGVLGSVAYRFPLLRNINKQFLHVYFRDLYGGVFYEAANAWNENEFKTTGYKKSLGYELRLSLGSFYAFPTAISFVSAYSFDPVSFVDPGFGNLPVTTVQERRFSYYVTVGFGFTP